MSESGGSFGEYRRAVDEIPELITDMFRQAPIRSPSSTGSPFSTEDIDDDFDQSDDGVEDDDTLAMASSEDEIVRSRFPHYIRDFLPDCRSRDLASESGR